MQWWPLQWIEESTVQLLSSTYNMFMVLYHLLSSAIWKCNDGYWWEHSLHSKPPTQGRCPRQQDFRKSLFNFFFSWNLPCNLFLEVFLRTLFSCCQGLFLFFWETLRIFISSEYHIPYEQSNIPRVVLIEMFEISETWSDHFLY